MAEKFKKVMAMVLSLALLATFCAVPMTASAEDTNLKFADKKFKILIFADTQDQYPVYASLLNRMRLAIEKEQPDLVVFTGDQTEINTKEVEVDFRRTIERILSPVVEAGIPYAFTFGNHDPQSAHKGQITSKDAMYKVYKTIGNCLTTDLYVDSGETDESLNISGTGTCKIPIYSSDGSKVAFNLWMVDSGSYQDPLDTSSGYGSVQDDQLAWMKANNDAGINSFVFQHIPMPQIYELLKEDPNGGTTYNGKTYALELNENATGEINEFPAPCYANKSNEFAALKEMGNVLCVFTGHDHRNDFTGTYDGITMTNVPGMTYFNYGDEAMRGYGVIELNEDDLSTYDYHTVKFSELDAEAGITTEVKYDDYDIIEYTDLKDENGNKLADSYTIKGGHTFTYDATSPSYSAVLKYRWTAGSKPGFQFSFDQNPDGNISHPFGVWIKNTEQVAPNGSWELKPNESKYAVKMDKPIETGKTYDIELGRLLVLSGSPQHVGQYYVYLKVNGVLIQEGYSNTADGEYVSGGADCHVSNVIRFGGWGNGGDDVISASPFVEIYEDYDDIGYTDLLRNGSPVNQSGRTITGDYDFTYNLTSPTSSAKFSFCWTAGSDQKIKVYLGWVGDGYNKFAYRTKEQKWIDLSGKNSDKPVNSAIAEGTKVNIEVGRLKVKNGANKGKYYSYFKADGVLIFESYVSAEDAAPYLNNTIRLSASNGVENGIGPEPEVLSDYEVIEYEDLYYNGDPVNVNGATIKGTKDYTYYATSPTFSTAFKFRWTAGSDQKIQVYLGNAGNYFAYRIKEQKWIDLSTSESVAVTSAIAEGDKVDIEVGRVLVAKGINKGKYYSYLKANDELIFDDYVSAADAAAYLNNKIRLIVSSDVENRIGPMVDTEPEEPEEPVVPDEPEVETYDVPDVITYNDLRDGNGNPLGAEHTLSGGFDLTYDAKSPSHSAVFKFRFIAGSKAGVQVSFDQGDGSNIANPFGLWIKRTDQTAPNGSWHLKPHDPNLEVPMSEALVAGKAYDIELGRKLVLTGENKGLYYVYLEVDGKPIQKGYSAVDENGYYTSGGKTDCKLSNVIRFGCWGNGAEDKMTATPEPETFEPYDELTFDDLYEGSTSMLGKEMDGSHNYTYNATSDSYSMVLKYRWVAGGSEMKFTTFLDDWKYPFCFAAKTPNQTGFGATAGENGAWHLVPSNDSFIKHMDEPIVAGKAYDIEIGRKKVATGVNKGQYYVYAKVNGEMIKDYYYDGVVDGAYNGVKLSNKIIISSPAGNKFSAIPIPETFEAYDELTFDDLWIGEASMSGREMDGRHDYTYNATSPTYSMKLKYRWIAGETPKFSLYLDDWKYPFCYAVKTPNQTGFGATAGPNGAWHLVPSDDNMIVHMDEPIVVGKAYDIEIGRLKVASGKNAGKYYVYFMVDGEIVQSYYYDGVVDGVYNGVALSNKIIVDASAGNKFTAVPFVEEYEDYDEIGFADLKENGNSLEGQTLISGHKVFTYNKTSPTGSVVFKYNWKVGSVAKFQLSFDKYGESTMSYMFGAQLEPKEGYPNGNMWLRPSFGPEVNLPSALAANSSHNVEFARLKVKNGSNKGKYYVYIKIDDVIIAEDYVGADVVDADGNYLSNSGKAYALSNEILFTFWGSEGNIISAYKEKQDAVEPEGTKGDFDGDGVINATDVTSLTKILLGVAESTEGMADFNGDGKEDIRDLVAMKNYLAPVNSYEKTGSLTLGMQEHLLSDATKTAAYIADATATMGAKAYRLSKPIHTLYYANSDRTVTVKTDAMNEFKAMVAELKAKGITEILYVTDSFILPAGYSDPTKNHNITVPDPVTDTENYVAWLQVNAAAFKALAQEVPEIKYFEPFNEINTTGTRFEKYGIGWNATSEEQADYKFTVEEKAAIMADLCWYISDAVKSVDSANQVTSPSIVVGSNSTIENDFIDEFYKAIESGNHPINKAITDKRVDNYFTIVNLHAYPDYTEDDSWLTDNFKSNAEKEVNEWAGYINTAYNVVKNHNDGNSRVWLTETGMSSYHPDGTYRDDQNVADIIGMALEKLDNDLTFIDTVIFYKIANISANNGASPSETNFGLFYSGDDYFGGYDAKPSALTIYSYFHNGEDGTAVLEALANRYKA